MISWGCFSRQNGDSVYLVEELAFSQETMDLAFGKRLFS